METLPLDQETADVVAKELGEVEETPVVHGPRQYLASQAPPTSSSTKQLKSASLEQIKIRDEVSW